jgi:thiol:disulfide interchange protein DsbD
MVPRLAAGIGIALGCATSSGLAQNPVRFSGESAGRVARGGHVDARVRATIDPGWHIYSLTQGRGGPVAMRLTLADSQWFALRAPATGPVPRVSFDANFHIDVETYEQDAAFSLPIRVGARAPVGADTIQVRARYQVCNAAMCLPVRVDVVRVPVTVVTTRTTPPPH